MIKGIDYTGVTCGCICLDGSGRFLMSKRAQTCRDEQGTWEIGGGSIKFGEPIEDHVRREMLEEYNATLKGLRLLQTVSLHREKDGRSTHWILLVWSGLVENLLDVKPMDADVEELGWFTVDNLPKPLHSTVMLELEIAKKHGIL